MLVRGSLKTIYKWGSRASTCPKERKKDTENRAKIDFSVGFPEFYGRILRNAGRHLKILHIISRKKETVVLYEAKEGVHSLSH